MDETLSITISGTRPLLMHSPQNIGRDTGSKKNSNYDPHDEAEAGLYTSPDGTIGVPGLAVLAALRKAGTEHKAKGRGRKTLKDFVYSGIRVEEDLIKITPQEWQVDARPAVIQRSRIMRWRPRFDDWKLSFTISIIDPSIWDPMTVLNVLEDTGRFVGLLDFRPLFGTFKVESFKGESGKSYL